MADHENTQLLSGAPKKSNGRRALCVALIVVAVLLVAAGVVVALLFTVGPLKPSDDDADQSITAPGPFAETLTLAALFSHIEALSAVALSDPAFLNSRSVTRGYNASADYIYQTLKDNTDYDVYFHYFNVSVFENLAPANLTVSVAAGAAAPSLSLVADTDFVTLTNSGTVNITNANLYFVAGGCNASDYQSIPTGAVVLVNRDLIKVNGVDCNYHTRIAAADSANVSAIVFYPGLLSPTPLGGSCQPADSLRCSEIGIVSLSSAAATRVLEVIASSNSTVISLSTSTRNTVVVSKNVIADTPTGREDRIILLGSHLDSVPAGPGLNDDASGSAVTLETAIQFHRNEVPIQQKLRFAFWSAEELGLLGSTAYVASLSPEELANIAVNLNNDMIASPNFFRGIYNGTDAAANIRVASTVIQRIHEQYFDSLGLAHEPTPFTGRSDYGPFIAKGIPAGGLFTGAEEIKTVEQREKYGGLANVAFDPCYHQACDDLENVSKRALVEMGRAVAFVSARLALEEDIDGFLEGLVPI